MRKQREEIVAFLKEHKKPIVILALLVITTPLLLIAVSYYTVNPYKKFVLADQDAKHVEMGLVLGAGITKAGKPFEELQARLDSAAEALDKGVVNKLILSGDNRFEYYDEPSAMKRYLVEKKHIAADKLVADYAGRSTYESCERASKIFKVEEVIIFSAGSHLPRAIYLCRHFNIESYGIASNVEANNSTRRELLARVKAVYNARLIGEPTVLGDPIPLQ